MARARRKSERVRHLAWRGQTAYYQRRHRRLISVKRPKGRAYFSLDTKDADEARRRVAAVDTLADRGDWDVLARVADGELHVDELVRAVREGEYRSLRLLHREGMPLEKTADAYLARVEATLGKRTREKYGQVVDAAVAHFGADKRLHEVSTADAEAYLYAEKGNGKAWAPRTQASHRNTLGALWRFAMEREHEEAAAAGAQPSLTINPWRKAKGPKLRRTRFSYLTPLEARLLLANAEVRNSPARGLLATAIYAGLRASELAHLRTDLDVVLGKDAASSEIIIQGREGEHAWDTKTDRSVRRLRPIPALYDILVEHKRRYAGERYFFPPDGADVPPNLSTLRRWTMEAFKEVGIQYGRRGEALTLHSLRHTYVTWQVAAGIPIPTVAKRAGDSEIVILQTYAHAMPEAAERADAVLQSHAEGGGAVEKAAK